MSVRLRDLARRLLGRCKRPPAGRPFRPGVGRLEDRVVPAAVLVNRVLRTTVDLRYDDTTKQVNILDANGSPTSVKFDTTLLLGNAKTAADFGANAAARFELVSTDGDATTAEAVRVTRGGNGGTTPSGNLTAELNVIDFLGGVRVERPATSAGTVAMNGGTQEVNVALATAAPADRSFVVLSSSMTGGGLASDGEWSVRGELSTANNLRLRRSQYAEAAAVAAQVVVFDADSGSKVVAGTQTLTSTATSVALPSTVDPAASFLLFSNSTSGAAGVEGKYRVSGTLVGNPQNGTRSAVFMTGVTPASGATVTYYVVSIAGAKVQGNNDPRSFNGESAEGGTTANEEMNTHVLQAAITPVDGTRSFAFATTSGGTAGRTDTLGDTSVIPKLNAGGVVVLSRADRVDTPAGGSSLESAARTSWAVVELPTQVAGDLVIIDQNGNELSEQEENQDGGVVLLNNDNDNYNFIGDQATSTYQLQDKDENGPVAGEDDLMQIHIKPDANNVVGSKFVLEFFGNIRIWSAANKGQEIISGQTEFDATVTTVAWVEGVSTSSTVGDTKIKLMGKWQTSYNPIDEAAVSVVGFTGPSAVPEYSKLSYSFTAPVDFSIRQWAAQNGTVLPSPLVGPIGRTETRTVFWGVGARVGGITVDIQSTAGRKWTMGIGRIDIVHFDWVSTDGINRNRITYNNADYDYVINQTAEAGIAYSSKRSAKNPGPLEIPAVIASVKLYDMRGPDDGKGGTRGERYMEIGIIQTIEVVNDHADFNFEGPIRPGAQPVRRTSSLDPLIATQTLYLDGIADRAHTVATTTSPWYDSRQSDITTSSPYFKPTSDGATGGKSFILDDSPHGRPTDQLYLTSEGENGVSAIDGLDFISIAWKFNMYVAARTVQTLDNDAASVYTQYATADWTFDASGGIKDNVWKSTTGVVNSGKDSFIFAQSGLQVSIPPGKQFNLVPETWVTIPQ